MRARDFSADYEAVVRGDMTPDEFIARRTTEELRAFPRVSSIQAQVEHSRLADADLRRRLLSEANQLRRAIQAKQPKGKSLTFSPTAVAIPADAPMIGGTTPSASPAVVAPQDAQPPRDPVTRYMLGQIDTIEFLTEYDRPEVPPSSYVDDSEALRRAHYIARLNDAGLMA